jgi:chloramphenicol 3-O-phosphotransferase
MRRQRRGDWRCGWSWHCRRRGHREKEVEFAAETRLSFTTRAPVTIH